jgi:hypothetical protein
MNEPENRLGNQQPRHMSGGENEAELEQAADVRGLIEALREVPARDPSIAAAGRRAFIDQIGAISKPVSLASKPRHTGWRLFRRKERSPMMTLARLALVLTLLLGGAGATTFAAQASMPSDALYPVKLFTEDVHLGLTTKTQSEFNLLLNLANKRVDEIVFEVGEGHSVSNRVTTRLQQHLQTALEHAAQLDDQALQQAMEQLHTMAQVQTQTLSQLQAQASSNSDEALQLSQQTMAQLQIIAQGAIEDPTTFRLRLGANRPDDAPLQPENVPPGPSQESGETQPGKGPSGPPVDSPQGGDGSSNPDANPQGEGPSGSGQGQKGYGSEECPCAECTPEAGQGQSTCPPTATPGNRRGSGSGYR